MKPMRPISKIAPEWWDYTTLDREILDDAARLTAEDMAALSRPGFTVKFYDTLEDFYLAEALEYITGHDDVWVTTGREIADWYLEHHYDEALASIARYKTGGEG